MTTHVFLVVRWRCSVSRSRKVRSSVASFLTPAGAGCSPVGGLGSVGDPRSHSPAVTPPGVAPADALGAHLPDDFTQPFPRASSSKLLRTFLQANMQPAPQTGPRTGLSAQPGQGQKYVSELWRVPLEAEGLRSRHISTPLTARRGVISPAPSDREGPQLGGGPAHLGEPWHPLGLTRRPLP